MELYPKRKTDAEYVESMRKVVKRSKRTTALFALGGLIQLACFWMLWRMIHSLDGIMAEVSTGVHIGIMLGAMGGMFIMLAGQAFFFAEQAFHGHRSERLMLRFHDELKELTGSNKTPEHISEDRGRPSGNAQR